MVTNFCGNPSNFDHLGPVLIKIGLVILVKFARHQFWYWLDDGENTAPVFIICRPFPQKASHTHKISIVLLLRLSAQVFWASAAAWRGQCNRSSSLLISRQTFCPAKWAPRLRELEDTPGLIWCQIQLINENFGYKEAIRTLKTINNI